MDRVAAYFVGNRLWWAIALFVGPVIGAATGGGIAVAVAATCLLVLPSFVLFDAGRPWWPDAVRALPKDGERPRRELRRLNVWSLIGLVAGVVIALAMALDLSA